MRPTLLDSWVARAALASPLIHALIVASRQKTDRLLIINGRRRLNLAAFFILLRVTR